MRHTHTATLRTEWGHRIRAAREAKGLTVAELAGLVGIDPSNISRIEYGTQGADDQTRMGIALALDTRVEELFSYPTPDQEAS